MTVNNNTEKQRFEVVLGDEVAVIDYILKENRILFTRTSVPKAFEGQGIASKMARAALEYAKKNKLRVSSLCSYVDTYISRHPEYKNLLEL